MSLLDEMLVIRATLKGLIADTETVLGIERAFPVAVEATKALLEADKIIATLS